MMEMETYAEMEEGTKVNEIRFSEDGSWRWKVTRERERE
jgi:hypothetical protein